MKGARQYIAYIAVAVTLVGTAALKSLPMKKRYSLADVFRAIKSGADKHGEETMTKEFFSSSPYKREDVEKFVV